MKIGIIKEGKIPTDKRVPLSPKQAKQVKDKFKIEFVVQTSDIRCFSDDDYRNEGLEIVQNIDDCDVILGVKEVPLDKLMAGKTHFFFSHTIKKQDYNRELLQTILQKKIRLIDWETLVDGSNKRVIAFGRWAGIVGAYNAFWTYGKRYNAFDIKRANECLDYAELKAECKKIKLPKLKIVLTGGGRVTKGAMEVLHEIGIQQVNPADFTEKTFETPVFTQLNSSNYNKPKDGGEYKRDEFYAHPENFEGDFLKYAHTADMLIAGAFWHPKAPVLFTADEMKDDKFNIKIIADITCDIKGSIPSTIRPSTIADPVYDYEPTAEKEEAPFSDEGNVTVMAVDNLPCELPRDASEAFGEQLMENVLPSLLVDDAKEVIKRATITTFEGKLTERFAYLQDYVDGK